MKTLILLRGLPGSGKSTLAKAIGGLNVEADMFFTKEGEYKFDPTKLKRAHDWCHDVVENWMDDGQPLIVVSNTFTQAWEMEFYFTLAKTYGYQVHSIIVENRHNGKNVHGCPEDKVEAMRSRFSVTL
jgi:predicted kinase